MLVAVPLAFQQQAAFVPVDRQMPILPQLAVYGFIPKSGAGEQGWRKWVPKFAVNCTSAATLWKFNLMKVA